MNVNNERIALTKDTEGSSECTDLIVQEEALPQEKEEPATGITATTEFIGDMDDYDRAVETEVPYTQNNAVWNREVRLITDSRGRRLCAWIDEDDDGNKIIVAVQQYKDGTYSPEWEMSKANIVISAMAPETMDDVIKKKIKRFLLKTFEEYVNKFNGQADELLSVQEIVNLLNSELGKLPLYRNGFEEMERKNLYTQLFEMVGGLTSQAFNDHKDYFPITEDDLSYVAGNFGLDKIRMLKRLKKHNLLFLTPSSRGLQNGVRITDSNGSYTTHRYCIRKVAEYEKNEEYTTYNF